MGGIAVATGVEPTVEGRRQHRSRGSSEHQSDGGCHTQTPVIELLGATSGKHRRPHGDPAAARKGRKVLGPEGKGQARQLLALTCPLLSGASGQPGVDEGVQVLCKGTVHGTTVVAGLTLFHEPTCTRRA